MTVLDIVSRRGPCREKTTPQASYCPQLQLRESGLHFAPLAAREIRSRCCSPYFSLTSFVYSFDVGTVPRQKMKNGGKRWTNWWATPDNGDQPVQCACAPKARPSLFPPSVMQAFLPSFLRMFLRAVPITLLLHWHSSNIIPSHVQCHTGPKVAPSNAMLNPSYKLPAQISPTLVG